jgi:hypothetical protein
MRLKQTQHGQAIRASRNKGCQRSVQMRHVTHCQLLAIEGHGWVGFEVLDFNLQATDDLLLLLALPLQAPQHLHARVRATARLSFPMVLHEAHPGICAVPSRTALLQAVRAWCTQQDGRRTWMPHDVYVLRIDAAV